MIDLLDVLRDKISTLEDEKEELEEELATVNLKLELYGGLLAEEAGETKPTSVKKRGRPRGSKNRKTSAKKASKESSAGRDELWKQAKNSLPGGALSTSPEEQERALQRFNPTPRPVENYGVKAGKLEDVMDSPGKNKTNVNIRVEDDA